MDDDKFIEGWIWYIDIGNIGNKNAMFYNIKINGGWKIDSIW